MSLPAPEILGTTLFGAIAGAVLIHGITKHVTGPTPDIRREGLDEVMDVVIGSAMLAVLYTITIASPIMPSLTHAIASSIPINNETLTNYLPNDPPRGMLRWAYGTAWEYFNETAGWYSTFWGTVLSLSIIPQTSPLGWYLQQATWYLQMMITYTIINLGMIYAINLIAYNTWWLLPLGIGLVIVRQTRSLGTFIAAFLLITSILGPLLTAYTAAMLQKPLNQLGASGNAWGNAAGALHTIIDQGYQQALAMQTFDVTVDVILAMALAASYGLYRVLDETIVDVLPI